MKGKFDAYVLWPLDKRIQNRIVVRSTARDYLRYFRNDLNPLWILVLNLDLPRSSDPKMSRFFHAYLAGAIGLRGPIHKLNMSSIIYFLAGVLGGTLCYFGEFLGNSFEVLEIGAWRVLRTWQPFMLHYISLKLQIIPKKSKAFGFGTWTGHSRV